MYKTEKVSILQLTKLIGLLSSTAQAVLPAQLQFRYLQQIHVESLSRDPLYQHQVSLISSAKQELLWWVQNLKLCNGRCLVQCVRTSGSKISPIEFHQKQEVKARHIQIDNTTALRYLTKMGGVKSLEMIKLSKVIWDYLLSRGITITTEYLPSKLNIITDRESREKADSSEWKLNPKVFQGLVQLMGNPVVDLFASGLNHQLPQYIAWRPDPFGQGTDAMYRDWSQDYLYVFTLFCLISRILHKVGQERTPSMLLITPTWHTQPWYPSLLQMSIETPVILPRIKSLLKDRLRKEHPLSSMENLRERLSLSGVLETPSSLIVNPRRSSCTGNYESAWRK